MFWQQVVILRRFIIKEYKNISDYTNYTFNRSNTKNLKHTKSTVMLYNNAMLKYILKHILLKYVFNIVLL
jgi:trans-aconitate methyltransferase